MNTKPCVLIVSSSNTKPKSIIKLITKQTPQENPSSPKVTTHPWKLETKYYTAEIDLIGITEDDINRNDDFNNNVEALIIHMDSNKISGLDDLQLWESIQTDCDPDVKLLISNYCDGGTKVPKVDAIEWCLKRGFEFIELYPAKVEIEEDNLIEEKVGVERIIEALQAHMWSNLVMIDEKKNVPKSESVCDVNEILTDQGADDFSELFNQLHLMKDSIQSLPMRERKQCAEQMVTAFWKAIGGDEEEIADI